MGDRDLNNQPVRWSRLDWLLLLGVTALGAGLRFYQLGETPPGFQFDEAFNAIDAAQVLHGNFPLFLPANAGREVLYTYFQAALGALFGVNVYTLRLASALLGTAAVGATYLLLRGMLQRNSRLVAAFTSLVLAVSVWHIHFSHYGIRVITMPLLLSALFGAFWLGVHGATRRTRLWAFVCAGVLAGLGVWTNPTGRLTPFVLVAYTLWHLWRHPQQRGLRLDRPLGGLLLAGGIAFVVFLPLGIEFYRHPDWFSGHAAEVSIFAERVSGEQPLLALMRNTVRVLGMFSIAGHQEWAHGPTERPVFDPLMSIPFMLGVVLWVRRIWRKNANDPDVDALFLLALWALIMLLPSVFSEAAPNFSRTLPALPAAFVAAGLGLTWLAQWRRPAAWAGTVMAGLIVIASGGIAFYDYFIRFPQLPQVYFAYEANKLDALQQLESQADEYEIYLHPLWAEHPPVRFLRNSKLVKALDTAGAIVLPPVGAGAIYAYPPELLHQADELAALWPGMGVETIPDKYGGVLYAQVRVEAEQLAGWPPAVQPVMPLAARFEDAPTLLGMQAVTGTNEIVLFWRGEERQTVRDLTAFIHLISPDGDRVGQIDRLPGNGSYRTTGWSPGERVIERYRPELSDPCAGGDTVQVVVGWYELAANGARRPRLDAPGDTALAGKMTLPVVAHSPDPTILPNQVNLAVAPGLTLLAYEVRSADLQPDAPLVVDLYWQAAPDLPAPSPVLHLMQGSQSIPLWQGALAPDTTWPAGEVICRRLRMRLPPDIAPGNYQLALAMPAETMQLTPFQPLVVGPPTRQFAAPPISTHIAATLGDAIQLLGYNLVKPAATNEPLVVELVWQALAEPQQSYTVFVHLLDEQGVIVTQSDALPGGGYATNRWLAGEVVVDSHQLALPADLAPDTYTLAAGMYDALSGQRLPVVGEDWRNGLVLLGEITLPGDIPGT